MFKRKAAAILLTGTMIAGTIAPMSVQAAGTPSSSVVQVSYRGGNVIPDPDNPTTAKWGVAVPTAVTFTDAIQTQDIDVELQDLTGAATPGFEAGLSVEVKVKSANGYSLTDVSNNTVAYEVTYGATNISSGTTDTLIATLDSTTTTQPGTAELTGNALSSAQHSDTLTYTIQKQ